MFLKHLFYFCSLACVLLFTGTVWSAESDVAQSVTYCYPNEEIQVYDPIVSSVLSVLEIDMIIQRYSRLLGLNSKLLRAVIAHESGFVTDAYNPDDPSYGLGQVMPKFWRYAFVAQCGSEATPETLMDPKINICYSAHILRHFMDEYGPIAGVDAYNNGTGESRGYSDTVLRGIDD